MERSECSICDNTFDADSHRPRAMPCGHGFCTQCIQSCIDRGNTACPVCRMEHGANSATSLPVSFLLEELLQKATISAPQTHEPVPVQTDKVIMCPEHSGVPLHFHCKTHGKEICHSCAVIDHPPTSCKLISIKDKMKEMKETDIETVQQGKKGLMDTENDLNRLYQEKEDILTEKEKKKLDLEKEVESLLTKIEQAYQEITETKKSKEHIKDSILICQKKQKAMDSLETKLRRTAGNQAISQECANTTSEIMKIRKWEDELRKELKLNHKYGQVHRNGTIRSSKIIHEGGRMLIPSLSAQLKPVRSAKLVKEAEMGLTSASTKVFLELSAPGCCLGRVIINVHGFTPHGEQFILLALGSDGPTLKGANFVCKENNYIGVQQYVTEAGLRSDKALLNTLKKEYKDVAVRGQLFPNWADKGSFIIMINNYNNKFHGHFGNVIDGMDVIDRAASGEFAITDITIINSGIILNY